MACLLPLELPQKGIEGLPDLVLCLMRLSDWQSGQVIQTPQLSVTMKRAEHVSASTPQPVAINRFVQATISCAFCLARSPSHGMPGSAVA
jgi:hypothetical protein